MMAVPAMAHDDPFGPSIPLRWQARFYRSYLADTLRKLANDPNPAVQQIGRHMDRCLNCAHSDRCEDCPFGPHRALLPRQLAG